MDALEDTQSSLGVCCCCLAEGSYKDMMRPYTWIGQDEIYSTMLIDCFGIDITSLEVAPWLDSKRLICELCIARLREASSFKTQVEQAQKTYVDRLKTFNFRDITKPDLMAPAVKLEQLDDSEVDHYNDLVDDFAVDDDMSDILPAVTSRKTGSGRPKAKARQRPEARQGPRKPQVVAANVLRLTNVCPFRLTKNGSFACVLCTDLFFVIEKLREHFDSAHVRSLPRDIPGRTPSIDPMKIDITKLRCRLCDCQSDDLNALKLHLSEKHGEDLDHTRTIAFKLEAIPYNCQVCREDFYSIILLNRHMNQHFQNHICSVCGKGFMTWHRFKAHAVIHTQKKFACSRCDQVFDSPSLRVKHITTEHRPSGGYKCPRCGLTFMGFHKRRRHVHEVHNVMMKLFNCSLCRRVFKQNTHLKKHIRSVHLGEKDHQCTECEARFFSMSALRMHAIKHNAVRKFQCDVCKKAYARIKTLKEHMRIHMNDRRYVCTICKKGFVQNCSLKGHVKKHHSAVL